MAKRVPRKVRIHNVRFSSDVDVGDWMVVNVKFLMINFSGTVLDTFSTPPQAESRLKWVLSGQ